jgi:exopolysaccharide biosynthesis protein
MLVIEGRNIDSLGTDASECADILARYGAYQAMNMDGGTSAILRYQGGYITKCSNEDLPEGRHLPNAWIYAANTVPDP